MARSSTLVSRARASALRSHSRSRWNRPMMIGAQPEPDAIRHAVSAFPDVPITGADGDRASLERAAVAVAQAGHRDRVELVRTPLEELDHEEDFDLVWWEAIVRLELPCEAAVRRIPPTVGQLRPGSSSTTLLRIGADHLDWLARYLVGLTCDLEILAPVELVDAVRQLGERLAASGPRVAISPSGSAPDPADEG